MKFYKIKKKIKIHKIILLFKGFEPKVNLTNRNRTYEMNFQ